MTMIITNIVFFIANLYISFIALKRYLNEPKNYEHTLYWGVAFLFNSIHFITRAVCPIISINSSTVLINMVQIVSVISWWLQLFAVMFVVFDSHNPIIRKKIRVFMYLIVIYFITFSSITNIINPLTLEGVGIKSVDLFFNINFAIFALIIGLLLLKVRNYGSYLYFPYFLMVFSNIAHIINVYIYDNVNLIFKNINESLAVAAVLTMMFEVRKVIKGDINI
ncbi:MAG: hypothetical protein ACOCRK_06820 [bacterium]